MNETIYFESLEHMVKWKDISSCPEGVRVLLYREDQRTIEFGYFPEQWRGHPELAYVKWAYVNLPYEEP